MATDIKLEKAIVQIRGNDYTVENAVLRLPIEGDFDAETRYALQGDGTEFWTSTKTTKKDVRKAAKNYLDRAISKDDKELAPEFRNAQSNNYSYAKGTIYKGTNDESEAQENAYYRKGILNPHISDDKANLNIVENYLALLEDRYFPQLEDAKDMIDAFCEDLNSGRYKEAIEDILPEFCGQRDLKNKYIDAAIDSFYKEYSPLSKVTGITRDLRNDLEEQFIETPGYVLWKMGSLMDSGRALDEFKKVFDILHTCLIKEGNQYSLNRIEAALKRHEEPVNKMDKSWPVTIIAEQIIEQYRDKTLTDTTPNTSLSVIEKYNLAKEILKAKDVKFRVASGGKDMLDLVGTLRQRISDNEKYKKDVENELLNEPNMGAADAVSENKGVKLVIEMEVIDDVEAELMSGDTVLVLAQNGNLTFRVFYSDDFIVKAISQLITKAGEPTNISGAESLLDKTASNITKFANSKEGASDVSAFDSKRFIKGEDEEAEEKNEGLHWYFTESLKGINKRTKIKHILPCKDGFMFSTKR